MNPTNSGDRGYLENIVQGSVWGLFLIFDKGGVSSEERSQAWCSNCLPACVRVKPKPRGKAFKVLGHVCIMSIGKNLPELVHLHS